MSLRSQLEELLPELLPSDPAQAIKGTELIRLVRLRLGEEYSDASLRYHFSFMASEFMVTPLSLQNARRTRKSRHRTARTSSENRTARPSRSFFAQKNGQFRRIVRLGSGRRTRTSDLRVMSPTSCQLLHPAIYR